MSQKKAELKDDQAVRSLLVTVINRIGPAEAWRSRLPDDSTERVVAQILRRADGVAKAVDLIKNAPTVHPIFEGTEIEEDLKKVPKKQTERLVGVTGEAGRELVRSDVLETFLEIWPKFEREILEAQGEKSKSATLKIVFNPETERADAHFAIKADTKAVTQERTRTSKVRNVKGKGWQLELFKSPVEK